MPYQSFFSGSSSGTATAPKSGGGYQSFFGSSTIAQPTKAQLQQQRQSQAQQDAQNKADQQQQQQKTQQDAKNNSLFGKIKNTVSNYVVTPVANTGKAIGDTAASIVQGAKGHNQQSVKSNQAAAAAFDQSALKPISQPFVATRDKIGQQVKYLSGDMSTQAQRDSLLSNQKGAAKSPAAATINKSSATGNNTAQGIISADKQAAQGKPTAAVSKTLATDVQAKKAQDRKALGTGLAIASDVVGGGGAAKAGFQQFARGAAETATAGFAGNEGSTLSANPNATGKELSNAGMQGALGGLFLHSAGAVVNKGLNPTGITNAEAKSALNTAKQTSLLGRVKQSQSVAPVLDANTSKALNTVMAGVHTPKAVLEATVAKQAATKTAADEAVKTAQATEKAATDGKKIDQKIELITAKKADGKFTNVDKVKIQQLKDEKAQLGPVTSVKPSVAPTEGSIPTVVETKPVAVAPQAESAAVKATIPVVAAKPVTRTLRPSETAHMPEITGYTHSEHLAQDYADMLRGQEQTVKGGQIIKNADGSYKRTSDHSRFFRDFYKENGKAPAKADYLEEARKQLENDKDGIGGGKDYKLLLEREAKPVPRVKIESTVSNAAQGTSKVAQDIAKSLKEKHADLAQYDHTNWKDQANKAVAVTENRELLDKVISGEAPLPDGLRATALITAIEKHPVLGKDSALLLKIANSPLAAESSIAAQELGLAAERVASSPIEALKNLRDVRQKAFEKRTGKSVTNATSDEIKAIRAAKVSVPKPTKETWSSFIDALKCN